MEIKKAHFAHLRNGEHFQFHKEVKELVEKHTPDVLNIGVLFPDYAAEFINESEAIELMRKNEVSEKLGLADFDRDTADKSLRKIVQAQLYHQDQSVVDAAERIEALLTHFRGITHKPYDEETGLIHSLVDDLNTKYADDVNLIGAADRVLALDTANKAFEALMRQRFSIEAGKTELRMKEVRLAIDAKYSEMIQRINAWILINGDEGYIDFVKELNERIDHYRQILSMRRRNKGGNTDKDS